MIVLHCECHVELERSKLVPTKELNFCELDSNYRSQEPVLQIAMIFMQLVGSIIYFVNSLFSVHAQKLTNDVLQKPVSPENTTFYNMNNIPNMLRKPLKCFFYVLITLTKGFALQRLSQEILVWVSFFISKFN